MDEAMPALCQERLQEWFSIETVPDEGETEPHRGMTTRQPVTTADAYTLEKYAFREKDGMRYFDRCRQTEPP